MASKEVEHRYIESFLRARRDLDLSNLTASESPDFLVPYSGRLVGIEVTRFSPVPDPGEPCAEEQDSLRKRVMEIARRLYRQAGGVPLHVQAIFGHSKLLSKARISSLASELANLLLEQFQEIAVYEHARYDNRGYNFVPELAFVSATRVSTDAHGAWYAAQGGWVCHATHDDVLRIVGAKEPLLAKYRTRCNSIWLLIVFEALGNDTYVRPPEEPIEFTVPSGFDRVFCLETIGDHCIEIRTTGHRT